MVRSALEHDQRAVLHRAFSSSSGSPAPEDKASFKEFVGLLRQDAVGLTRVRTVWL